MPTARQLHRRFDLQVCMMIRDVRCLLCLSQRGLLGARYLMRLSRARHA